MADGDSNRSGAIIWLVIVGVAGWFGYSHYTHKSSADFKQFLGDPRTACVYPIESVDKPSSTYVEGGVRRDNMDEFYTMKEAVAAGYRTCP